MKFKQRERKTVEAHQWFENGDHPEDGGGKTEGKLVRYFRHPDKDGKEVHERCGKRWHDHGWIEAKYLSSQNPWDEGEPVCPGDYIIDVRPGKYAVASKRSFERGFEPLGLTMTQPITRVEESVTGHPKVFPKSTWENMPESKQQGLIDKSDGAGVLVIPDEMFYRE